MAAEDVTATLGASWHLDKRVNISIIAAILLQAAIGVWQVAKMDSRLFSVEEKVVALQKRDEEERKVVEDVRGDLREIKAIVTRMEKK